MDFANNTFAFGILAFFTNEFRKLGEILTLKIHSDHGYIHASRKAKITELTNIKFTLEIVMRPHTR